MSDPPKPIGYWVKRLDDLLESIFDHALARQHLARRHWQVLNVLRGEPVTDEAVHEALAPFWRSESVSQAAIVTELIERGWIHRPEPGVLALTPAGLDAHTDVLAKVEQTRSQVIDGLSPEEYHTVVDGVRRMCDNVSAALAALRGPQRNASPNPIER
jgi:DNA-binding MarR family transcriptional regulator